MAAIAKGYPYNGKPYLANMTEESGHIELFKFSRQFI